MFELDSYPDTLHACAYIVTRSYGVALKKNTKNQGGRSIFSEHTVLGVQASLAIAVSKQRFAISLAPRAWSARQWANRRRCLEPMRCMGTR